MAQCIVIADDLTGGNAAGVQLRRSGFKVLSVLDDRCLEEAAQGPHDCLIYATDSRAISADEAYARVAAAARRLNCREARLCSKRIDTTLRGNLGAETDALLDCLGEDYIALAVPSFPTSGRVVVGGYLLVQGRLLHKTDIAVDPKCPVKQSETAEVFRQQSKYKVATVTFADMMEDAAALALTLRSRVNDGARIICCDALTQEDLDLLAEAALASGLKLALVDAGVFTATLARKLLKPAGSAAQGRILATVGSVHPLTAIQIKQLLLSQPLFSEEVSSVELLESPQRREAEISRVVEAVAAGGAEHRVCVVVGDGLDFNKRINFDYYGSKLGLGMEAISGLLNDSFAEITARILNTCGGFKGLYTSGGDVTIAVCRRLGASGIDLADEVLPLAAYGTLQGGMAPGLRIVTKGGSQGDENAIVQCLEYLKRGLSM